MSKCMCLMLSGLVTRREFQDIMGLGGIGGHCARCGRKWSYCSVCEKVYPDSKTACCRTVLDELVDVLNE